MNSQETVRSQEAGQPYILLVDDDPDILEGLVAVLESQPYRLNTARDGEECLEKIAEEIPDLVILDLLMPNSLLTHRF